MTGLIEELGRHKFLVYNWMLGKRLDGNDWVLILDSQHAARIAPKILEYYPRGTPANVDYTAMPTGQSYNP